MGLREDTIELIRKEGQFDMRYYVPRRCGTACCIAGNICLAAGIPNDIEGYDIPRLARQQWALQYGQAEADRLHFNAGWGTDLHLVTAEEAIAHLNGAPPVARGRIYLDEFTDANGELPEWR